MLAILKDLDRGTRILAVMLPTTLVVVLALGTLNPELSGDELATTVSVLLMVIYLYTRLSALVVTTVRPKSDQRLSLTTFGFFAAVVFLACSFATIVLLPSMAVYWLMDMAWSVGWAWTSVKACAAIAGCMATLICIKQFCWAAAVRIDDWSRRLMNGRFPWWSHGYYRRA